MTGGRVLVTGACGYLGSALVPRLQATRKVEGVALLDDLSTGSPRHLADCDLTSGDVTFHRADVREYGAVEGAVREAEPDAIVHLAAITGAESTHDREAETRAVNLEGTENVLTAARKFDVDRVAFASSCNVYGRADHRELDETVEPDPINPYAETKHDAESLLAEYDEEYGLETTALRFSTVFGHAPGIRFNLVVNAFVFRALTDRPLTVYGDGSNWRPFIHVDDAARALTGVLHTPERWPRPVYNVGDRAENYQIDDVARILRNTLDRDLDIVYLEDERPGPSYHVNFDRLAETGFDLEWTLPEGVVDLAAALGDQPGRHPYPSESTEAVRDV
jgi:nucleoside-diphosphate-sugar epimerase